MVCVVRGGRHWYDKIRSKQVQQAAAVPNLFGLVSVPSAEPIVSVFHLSSLITPNRAVRRT